MSKRNLIIIGTVVLIIGVILASNIIFNKEPEVSKEKLKEYQETVTTLDRFMGDYMKKEEYDEQDPIIEQFAMFSGMRYKDILVSPWSEEDNERKEFEYKIIQKKDGEEEYETLLINQNNNKYIDKKTGEIREIKDKNLEIISY